MVKTLGTYGKGLFVVFEGLDGCGKSLQASLLTERLLETFLIVKLTREPTNNEVGQIVRTFLQKKFFCSADLKRLLYATDRGIHLEEEITPTLNLGGYVICERYILSSYAYGVGDGRDLDWVKALNSRFIIPDLTILIDTDPKTRIKRIDQNRKNREYYEDEERMIKVRNAYLNLLPDFSEYRIVDGNREPDKIFEDIKDIVRPLIGLDE